MEVGLEGGKRKPPEVENKTKRKMKTASQLEILEKTYAVETYPSEALRAELSAKLGLSDRQLQMWFCHRRLKDRKTSSVKRPPKDSPAAEPVVTTSLGGNGEELVARNIGNEHVSVSALAGTPYGRGPDLRRLVPRAGVAIARISNDRPSMKRYYESQQSISELRAIVSVEAQLGEPLREDGPILGMEFDPLPPDAFGAPIATMGQQKLSGTFEANTYERTDVKQIKVAGRALHEYQFLPEQPTIKSETYDRAARSYHYGSPVDGPNARISPLSTGLSFMHRDEQVSSRYSFQGQVSTSNVLSQKGSHSLFLPSTLGAYEDVSQKNSSINIAMDVQYGAHPIAHLENPLLPSDRSVIDDENVLRMERKRKSDEVRIAREVEANEKRIRKELEKQDILRRKREEQLKKEMERHERERRKEEERLLREKQREEERYLREQRREMERREKFLQKETIRVERIRQKEELRREKKAARLKAANERAIARRIAKESGELIEDEHLELMEVAASSKGLPSILSLDFESLQNLELCRDMLAIFPPKLIKLKRPFSIQPWTDSEDNVGNLLMVWKFLITFADVLGLWSFTLDEFVQAFHDNDARLIGEIHVSLLKSIIKDIEDVARTPAASVGANQNTAAYPGGGHPQIVEGAYAWGFDIRSWQHHLNPLTWPEILRQFALSAGFGPQLKKKNVDPSHIYDQNEGNEGANVVSNLRNGAAAENAFAIMQERGFSNQRRSRHCLTPGTVKFAAFHVLSLEGSKGLNILEVAEKIQKSGLRDLTTSKTPEASISAALSRDSKLFERIAPSTYCLRAAYRKDPAEAEAILSAARERVCIAKSGYLDGEDANDADRDEDSESDVAEDPEVYDLGTEINPEIEAERSQGDTFDAKSILGNGKESNEVVENPQVGNRIAGEDFSSRESAGIKRVKEISASINQSTNNATIIDQEDTDVDEDKPVESWVQGLSEGEYSDLSVDERLSALVALISIVTEGNSIRVVLEERLEAAKALKKKMWEDTQLDKRRNKEEYVMKMHHPSFSGIKTEPNLKISLAESRQSPSNSNDDNENERLLNPSVQEDLFVSPNNDHDYLNNLHPEGNLQMQDDPITGADCCQFQQAGLVADKLHSQLKSYIGHKAEEMYVHRSLPIGQDRRHNKYWRFTTSSSHNEPGCGRIFVELRNGCWRIIDTEECFDALLASLDVRGVRESHLHFMLQKIESSFKQTIRRKTPVAREDPSKTNDIEVVPDPDCNLGTDSPSSTLCLPDSDILDASTSFTIELGRTEADKRGAMKRYQDFENWMWRECYNAKILSAAKYGKKRTIQLLDICNYCYCSYTCADNHCSSCHKTFNTSESDINFFEHVAQCGEKHIVDSGCKLRGILSSPLRIRLLKVLLALIEVSIPSEALEPFWTNCYRKSWGMKLHSSSSAEDLLEILTLLESSIKRDCLLSNYGTTNELLGCPNPPSRAADGSFLPKTVPILPWMPLTTAAVALRLMEFDTSIYYTLEQKMKSEDHGSEDSTKLASTIGKSLHDYEVVVTANQHHLKEANWNGLAHGVSSSGRGHASHGCGRVRNGRSQRSSADFRKREKLGHLLTWKGGRPHGRGRRSRIRRSRRKASKGVVKVSGKKRPITNESGSVHEEPLTDLHQEGDRYQATSLMEVGVRNESASGNLVYDNENDEVSGYEYDLVADDCAGGFNGESYDILEGSDYNVDCEGDSNNNDINIEDEEGDDSGTEDKQEEGDLDIEEYLNGDLEDGNSNLEDYSVGLNEETELSSDE